MSLHRCVPCGELAHRRRGYLATGKVKVESGWRRVLLTPRPRRATTVAQLSKNSTYIGACFAFGLA